MIAVLVAPCWYWAYGPGARLRPSEAGQGVRQCSPICAFPYMRATNNRKNGIHGYCRAAALAGRLALLLLQLLLACAGASATTLFLASVSFQGVGDNCIVPSAGGNAASGVTLPVAIPPTSCTFAGSIVGTASASLDQEAGHAGPVGHAIVADIGGRGVEATIQWEEPLKIQDLSADPFGYHFYKVYFEDFGLIEAPLASSSVSLGETVY